MLLMNQVSLKVKLSKSYNDEPGLFVQSPALFLL